MRLILLGSLLHWKEQLPVGGVPVYSQMSIGSPTGVAGIGHVDFMLFVSISFALGLQERDNNDALFCRPHRERRNKLCTPGKGNQRLRKRHANIQQRPL